MMFVHERAAHVQPPRCGPGDFIILSVDVIIVITTRLPLCIATEHDEAIGRNISQRRDRSRATQLQQLATSHGVE